MIIIITVKLVEMPYNYTLYYSQKKTKDPLPSPTPLSLVTVCSIVTSPKICNNNCDDNIIII